MPTSEYTPTLAQVGSLLHARTKNRYGSEVGTFTADTRPTDVQATELIQQAVGDLSTSIGDDIPSRLFEEAQDVAALRAAMLIEMSFFPEQVGTEQSPYDEYEAMYEKRLERLVEAVAEASVDLTVDVAGAGKVQYEFPKPGPIKMDGMVW